MDAAAKRVSSVRWVKPESIPGDAIDFATQSAFEPSDFVMRMCVAGAAHYYEVESIWKWVVRQERMGQHPTTPETRIRFAPSHVDRIKRGYDQWRKLHGETAPTEKQYLASIERDIEQSEAEYEEALRREFGEEGDRDGENASFWVWSATSSATPPVSSEEEGSLLRGARNAFRYWRHVSAVVVHGWTLRSPDPRHAGAHHPSAAVLLHRAEMGLIDGRAAL